MRYVLAVLAVAVVAIPGSLQAQDAKKQGTKLQGVKQLDLSGLSDRLKKLVEAGKLSEEEARKLMDLVEKPVVTKSSPGASQSVDLDELANRLKAAVRSGKMTEAEAIAAYKEATAGQKDAGSKAGGKPDGKKPLDKKGPRTQQDWEKAYEQLLKNRPELRAKVNSGGATKAQIIAWMKQRSGATDGKAGKAKGTKGKGTRGKGEEKTGGTTNFYAIVIGRLKTKDIELGELTMEVDHVTSIYGSRWVKDEIVGKVVKVTGVSGAFRDQLLQIKRGETMKVRSGRYIPLDGMHQLTFAPKFHVLERAKPFKPEDYGVPPTEFRGFRGVLEGKIEELGGYEVTLRVRAIARKDEDDQARKAEVITGKLVRLVGFYNQHEQAFKDLNVGDVIRVGARHRDPTHDEFGVTEVLEKVR